MNLVEPWRRPLQQDARPLRQSATDTLNRQMKAGINDDKLAELVLALREEDRLCLIHDEEHGSEPQIVCSMGLARLTA